MSVDQLCNERGPMPQCFSPAEDAFAGDARRLRLLAYGDSLTAGFHSGGRRFAPYGEALSTSLAPGLAADIWVCGLSGLTALEMLQMTDSPQVYDVCTRSGKGIRRILMDEGPFDLAIVMAGTNDLGKGESPVPRIAADVQALHEACHSVGVRTAMLSVPPNRAVLGNASYAEEWRHLNALLSDWARCPDTAQHIVVSVDTAEIVPFEVGSELWETDGLHLSALGSKQLGERLAPIVATALAAAPPPTPVPEVPYSLEPMPQLFSFPSGSDGTTHLRILAFGDSLTAGFYAFGHLFAPYAKALGTGLLPSIASDIWVCGLSGAKSTEMVNRVQDAKFEDCVGRVGKGIQRVLVDHGPFDLALIMAGTNDLGTEDPQIIAANLQTLHKVCHRQGVRTVALSVPPSAAATRIKCISKRRMKVNKILAKWSKDEGREVGDGTGVASFVDTESIVPFSEQNGFWETDGLHFSRSGSRELGRGLAQLLRPLLVAAPMGPNSKRSRVSCPANAQQSLGTASQSENGELCLPGKEDIAGGNCGTMVPVGRRRSSQLSGMRRACRRAFVWLGHMQKS